MLCFFLLQWQVRLSFCIGLFLVSSGSVCSPSSIKSIAEALILFKKMVKEDPGGALSNWEMNRDVCSWSGVTYSLSRLTQLDLSGKFLVGYVSFYSLGSLDMLSVLKLASNSFTINLTSLLQLPYGLTHLDLSVVGLIRPNPPNFFSRCKILEDVNLSNNNLTGPLPENFFARTKNHRSLDISYNSSTEPISGLRIERSCALLQLNLSRSRISDGIPIAFSNCANLRSLKLRSNFFSSLIPRSFGQLRSLQRLDLSHNNLTRLIPSELSNACNSLLELTLSYNSLSSPILDSLSACTWLQHLNLSNNNIFGPFPSLILQNLWSLEKFLLSNSMILSPFLTSLSNCKNLRVADFSSNKFSSVIPPNLCPGATSLEVM